MPVSTQLIKKHDYFIVRTSLRDIKGQNVLIHWLKFIYDRENTFTVHMVNWQNIDYHMHSTNNEKMGHADNWLKLFKLPVFVSDNVDMFIFRQKDDVTCVYAWTPCDPPDQQPYYECYGVDHALLKDDECYDYVANEPIQDDWLKNDLPMIKYTPWHWKSKSPGYPFKEDADIVPLYIGQSINNSVDE